MPNYDLKITKVLRAQLVSATHSQSLGDPHLGRNPWFEKCCYNLRLSNDNIVYNRFVPNQEMRFEALIGIVTAKEK